MKRLVVVLTIPFIFTSCSFIQERLAVKKCKFSLQGIRPHSFSFTKMALDIKIGINNPNETDAVIDKLDLDLFIDGEKTVKVTTAGVRVKPKQTRSVLTSVTIPYKAVGMSIINIIRSGGEVKYKLRGTVYMNTMLGSFSFPVTLVKN